MPSVNGTAAKIVEAAVYYNVARLQGQNYMPEAKSAVMVGLAERGCPPEVQERLFRFFSGMVMQSGNLCWDQFVGIIGYDENLALVDLKILNDELLYLVVE